MKILNLFSNIKRGLKWFKRGYDNHEYDYGYLLEIVLYKLQDMKEFWSDEKQVHIIEPSRLRNLKNISVCCFLLKIIIDDDYLTICDYDILENMEFKFKKTTDDAGYSKLDIVHVNGSTKKIHRRIVKKAEALKAYDQKLFFKIFSRQYSSWWD